MTIARTRRNVVSSLALGALALSACGSGAVPLLDGAKSIGSGFGSGGEPPSSGGGAPPKPPPPPNANEKAAEEMQPKPIRVVSTTTGSGTGDKLGSPYGVAVDKQGALYVADLGGKRVLHFAPDGKFVREWKGGAGDAAFDVLVDIAIGPGDNVYVLDKGKGLVHVFSPDGQAVGQYGSDGPGFYNPFGLGAAADGYFVADTGTGRVVRFNPTGGKVAELGRGQLREPTGVLADGDGGVLVVDGAIGQLFRFSADGKAGSTTDVAVRATARIARLGDGSLLISDPTKARLLQWSADGKLLARYGEPGGEEGRFNHPTGLAVAPGGDVFVADTNNNRVVRIQLQ